MRMNTDNWQTFPASFILDLTLQLPIRPRVHSAAIPPPLTVSTLIQPPNTREPFHHDTEIVVLGLLHDYFGCVMEDSIHLLALPPTILTRDFPTDPHIVSSHSGANFTVSSLYQCRFGEVMFDD